MPAASDFTDAVTLGSVDLPGNKRLMLRRMKIRGRPVIDLRLFVADAEGERPTPAGVALAVERWPAVAALVAEHAQADAPAPGDAGGPEGVAEGAGRANSESDGNSS